MKTILLILILALIPFKSICQTTDINLSQPQAIEIYKGLLQGNNLKSTVSSLQSDVAELEKAVTIGKTIESELKAQIEKLNNIISDKNIYIDNQSRLNEIEKAKLKDKSQRRFGVGLVGGHGLSTGTNQMQSFIGVGISYDLFRF